VFWLALAFAFAVGLVVGRLWVSPLTVVGWVVVAKVHDHYVQAGRLEGNLEVAIAFLTSASVFGAAVAGVMMRRFARRASSRFG
jgi:hypothetical protein